MMPAFFPLSSCASPRFRPLAAWTAFLLVACACGSNGGGGDTTGLASISIRDIYGSPVGGLPVDAGNSGTVLHFNSTDAYGVATVMVEPNSKVSVHYSDPTDGARRTWTLGGVDPGDALEMPTFDLFPPGFPDDVTENLTIITEAVPDVTFVQANATYCYGGDSRSVPMGVTSVGVAVVLLPMCEQRDGLYSYWVEGNDASFERAWFGAVFDQPLGAEPTLVLSSGTASSPVLVQLLNLPVDMSPVPLLGPVALHVSGSHAGRPVGFGTDFLLPAGGGDYEQMLALPARTGVEAGALETYSQWATQGGQQWFVSTTPGNFAVTVDAGAFPSPPEVAFEETGDGRIRVLWSNTGGDVAIVTVSSDEVVWKLYVDPSTGSVTLPSVPVEQAEFVPEFANATVGVAIVDIDFIEGFRGYLKLDAGPLPEAWIVRGGASGSGSIVLRR